jgi:hypothetical protein
MADLSNTSEMSNDPATAATSSGRGVNGVDVYQLVKDAYKGTGGFRDGSYLIEHTRERDFTERRGYSYYLNYFKPILDALVNPVFKQQPTRQAENESWKIFESDCDRNKTSLTKFMRKVAKRARRDGVTFIVMDTTSEQPVSVAQARESRTLPYIYIKEAAKVITYTVSKHGELLSITFSEDAESTEKGKSATQVYRQWEKGKWTLWKKWEDGQLKEPIGNGDVPGGVLSVIPVYIAECDENEVLPHPPLYDIARLNAAIFNVCSELREVQRKQGFSILAIPKQGDINKAQEIGTSSALTFPADSHHAPHFITSDTSIQDGYMKERDKLIEEIYKQAKLAGVSGVIQQSGIAKQWDFEGTDTELCETARAIEQAERDTAELFQVWTEETFDFSISYPEDFGILDIDSDIERANGFIGVGMTPEIVTATKQELTRGYFKQKDSADVDALVETITVEEEKRKQVEDYAPPAADGE